MEKRPLSMTIIAWLLIVLTLFGLFGIVTMGSNPVAMKMLEQMHISLRLEQTYGLLGAVINLACAYAILKGLPWGRVLYVVWGVIGLVVGMYISPVKYAVVISLVVVVVIAAFLWTNTANDWFQARGLMLKRERSR
ncbi:MAG: hypothetical protein QOD54_298 [Sphingomonadales bacterium]|jgi:hypothetical protein|nr:hypothetical protein [Sphingomonadales bacterium]